MDGDTVYTDKNCEDIGAMDRLPAGTTGPSATGALYRGGCSRTLSDLVAQVSMAITAGDVNRLAGVYHWSGVSDASALRILDQLDAVVQRPLVDIVPVRPAPAPILDAAVKASEAAAKEARKPAKVVLSQEMLEDTDAAADEDAEDHGEETPQQEELPR